MKNYQSIENYKGSLYSPPRFVGLPEYMGIEYDKNVPNGNVVASPGGTASVYHSWTKGFYSQSTNDKYGGDGYRHLYGEFGNLYNVGDSASTYMGIYPPKPDQSFTKNQSFNKPIFIEKKKGILREMFTFPTKKHNEKFQFPKENQNGLSNGNIKKKNLKENFAYPTYTNLDSLDQKLSPDFVGYGGGNYEDNFSGGFQNIPETKEDLMMRGTGLGGNTQMSSMGVDNRPAMRGGRSEGFELLDDSTAMELKKDLTGSKKLSIKNPVLIFIIFLVAYMAMDFWSRSGDRLITLYFGNGQPLSWRQLAIVALSFTIILILFRYFLDFPLITFEQL